MHYDFLALNSSILPISARCTSTEKPAIYYYYYAVTRKFSNGEMNGNCCNE